MIHLILGRLGLEKLPKHGVVDIPTEWEDVSYRGEVASSQLDKQK